MEIADLIVVNKADGDLRDTARRTCADYAGALRLLRKRPEDPEDFPKAMMASALDRTGLDTVWQEVQALAAWRRSHGHFARRRAEQARHWFEEEVRQGLLARLREEPAARDRMRELGDAVAQGTAAPGPAAREVLSWLRQG